MKINKHYSLLVIFLFGISINVYANWFPQVSGTTQYLNSGYFINGDTGWVVGDSGIILKTINGGLEWNFQPWDSSLQLRDVWFVNDSVGWACGWNIVIKTTNGGTTWTPHITSSRIYNCIYFINDSIGWLLTFNGVVQSTINGGLTWQTSSVNPNSSLQSAYFINPDTGFIVGSRASPVPDTSGTIFKSTDGGINWINQTNFFQGDYLHFNSIFFTNTKYGWVVGGSDVPNARIILKTIDSGKSWDTNVINYTTKYLSSVSFVDTNIGWVVGANGTILNTTDGGNTWDIQNNGTTLELLNYVHFINKDTGWAIGANGTILKTTNGGITSIKNKRSHFIDNFNINIFVKQHNNLNINFNLTNHELINISIYDILGRTVSTLFKGICIPGYHKYVFQLNGLPQRLYVIKIKSKNFTISKRIFY